MIALRRGFRFLHRRLLATEPFDGKTPQLCEVTRVAQGVVYYRPVYADGLGNPGCFDLAQAARWVRHETPEQYAVIAAEDQRYREHGPRCRKCQDEQGLGYCRCEIAANE